MMNKEALAYLLGVYLSDGYVNRDGSFNLKVKDEAFRDTVAEALGVLRLPLLARNRPNGLYVVRSKGRKLGTWLVKVTGDKGTLPDLPTGLLREVTAGVLDGDGSIWWEKPSSTVTGHWRLAVDGSRYYLDDLARQWVALDIGVRGPRAAGGTNGICWRYHISLPDFVAAGFYFRLPRKQARLIEFARARAATTIGRGGTGLARGGRRAAAAAQSWLERWCEPPVWHKHYTHAAPNTGGSGSAKRIGWRALGLA